MRRGPRGEAVRDSSFLLLLNAHHEPIPFRIAPVLSAKPWIAVLDTALEADPFAPRRLPGGRRYPLQGRSLALLQEVAPP